MRSQDVLAKRNTTLLFQRSSGCKGIELASLLSLGVDILGRAGTPGWLGFSVRTRSKSRRQVLVVEGMLAGIVMQLNFRHRVRRQPLSYGPQSGTLQTSPDASEPPADAVKVALLHCEHCYCPSLSWIMHDFASPPCSLKVTNRMSGLRAAFRTGAVCGGFEKVDLTSMMECGPREIRVSLYDLTPHDRSRMCLSKT